MLVGGDFGPLSESAKKIVQQMSDTSGRLLSLAETFLNASRLEVGAYESQKVEMDPRVELQKLVDQMNSFAAGKGLMLSLEVSSSVPHLIRMDAEVFRNAVFNLIDNAIKYTSQGGVTVAAEVEHEALLIRVSDTGAGMEPAEAHQLFQKFHRGHDARAHDQDGTGLGLYIVRKLVEAAGGKITGESEGVGKGMTFILSLPFAQVDRAP
jgi:signal transduction histidine kinase